MIVLSIENAKMEEKDYIEKWLRGELNTTEQQEFEQLSTYAELTRMDNAAQQFKAPAFDSNASYTDLKTLLEKQELFTAKNQWKSWLLRIAAVLIVALCSYVFLISNNNDITIQTIAAGKQEVLLPDTSEVILNASSSLEYNKKSWEDQRSVSLDGEAFFKVAKGQRFDVTTTKGTVSVLGTQFNVKNRKNLLTVSCYEGLVQVTYGGATYKVPAGTTFTVRNDIVKQGETTLATPDWTHAKSSFESAPFSEVIAELERQYNVAVITKITTDSDLNFTGSFTHNNLETALKSITIPVQLKYSVKNSQVTISK